MRRKIINSRRRKNVTFQFVECCEFSSFQFTILSHSSNRILAEKFKVETETGKWNNKIFSPTQTQKTRKVLSVFNFLDALCNLNFKCSIHDFLKLINYVLLKLKFQVFSWKVSVEFAFWLWILYLEKFRCNFHQEKLIRNKLETQKG